MSTLKVSLLRYQTLLNISKQQYMSIISKNIFNVDFVCYIFCLMYAILSTISRLEPFVQYEQNQKDTQLYQNVEFYIAISAIVIINILQITFFVYFLISIFKQSTVRNKMRNIKVQKNIMTAMQFINPIAVLISTIVFRDYWYLSIITFLFTVIIFLITQIFFKVQSMEHNYISYRQQIFFKIWLMSNLILTGLFNTYYVQEWFLVLGIADIVVSFLITSRIKLLATMTQTLCLSIIPSWFQIYYGSIKWITKYHVVRSNFFFCGLILLILCCITEFEIHKTIQIHKWVNRQKLSQCQTCQDMYTQFKTIDGNLLFYDFIYLMNNQSTNQIQQVYKRFLLYTQMYKESLENNIKISNENDDDNKKQNFLKNCSQEDIICYILLIYDIFQQRFKQPQIKQILEKYCFQFVKIFEDANNQAEDTSNDQKNIQFQTQQQLQHRNDLQQAPNPSQLMHDTGIQNNTIKKTNQFYQSLVSHNSTDIQQIIDQKTIKINNLLQYLIYKNTGVMIIKKGIIKQDQYFICDLLSKEYMKKQQGASNIIPLSQYETKIINELLKKIINYSDKYIILLQEMERLSLKQELPTNMQIVQFNELAKIKITMIQMLQQLNAKSPYSLASSWATGYILHTILLDKESSLDYIISDLLRLDENIMDFDYSNSILEKLKHIQIFGNNIINKINNDYYISKPLLLEPQVSLISSNQSNLLNDDAHQCIMRVDLIDFERKRDLNINLQIDKNKKQTPKIVQNCSFFILVLVLLSLTTSLIYSINYNYEENDIIHYFNIQKLQYYNLTDQNVETYCQNINSNCQIYSKFKNKKNDVFEFLIDKSTISKYSSMLPYLQVLCESCTYTPYNVNLLKQLQQKNILLFKNNFKLYNDKFIFDQIDQTIPNYKLVNQTAKYIIIVTIILLGYLAKIMMNTRFIISTKICFIKYVLSALQFVKFKMYKQNRDLYNQQQINNKPLKQTKDTQKQTFYTKECQIDQLEKIHIKRRKRQNIIYSILMLFMFILCFIAVESQISTEIKYQKLINFNQNQQKSFFKFINAILESNYAKYNNKPFHDNLIDTIYNLNDQYLIQYLYDIQKMDNNNLKNINTSQLIQYQSILICQLEQRTNTNKFCQNKQIYDNYLQNIYNYKQQQYIGFNNQVINDDILQHLTNLTYSNPQDVNYYNYIMQTIIILIVTIVQVLFILYPINQKFTNKHCNWVQTCFIIASSLCSAVIIVIQIMFIITLQKKSISNHEILIQLQKETDLFNPNINDFIENIHNYTSTYSEENKDFFCAGLYNYEHQMTVQSQRLINDTLSNYINISKLINYCSTFKKDTISTLMQQSINQFNKQYNTFLKEHDTVQNRKMVRLQIYSIATVVISIILFFLILIYAIYGTNHNMHLKIIYNDELKFNYEKQFVNKMFKCDAVCYFIMAFHIFSIIYIIISLLKQKQLILEINSCYKDKQQLRIILNNQQLDLFHYNQISMYNITFSNSTLQQYYDQFKQDTYNVTSLYNLKQQLEYVTTQVQNLYSKYRTFISFTIIISILIFCFDTIYFLIYHFFVLKNFFGFINVISNLLLSYATQRINNDTLLNIQSKYQKYWLLIE